MFLNFHGYITVFASVILETTVFLPSLRYWVAVKGLKINYHNECIGFPQEELKLSSSNPYIPPVSISFPFLSI